MGSAQGCTPTLERERSSGLDTQNAIRSVYTFGVLHAFLTLLRVNDPLADPFVVCSRLHDRELVTIVRMEEARDYRVYGDSEE